MSRVSFTEIATWKKCRLQHHWRYDRNLEPNRYEPRLTLGTLCHAGIETWLKKPECRAYIQGILDCATKDIADRRLFEEEAKEVMQQAELASRIVAGYVPSQPHVWQACAVELPFDVRIPGTRNRIVGRFDAILEETNGNLWLCEWKFPKTFRSEEDVALSTQLAIYLWAAQRCGYPVVGILYNQVLARVPAIPELLKNGVSTSRKEVYTDWETYAATVKERGEDPASYEEEMKPKLAGKEFWRQYRIYRSPEQVERYVQELVDVSRDIATPKRRLYACESSITCGGCAYREICLEQARGRDPEEMIASAFRVRGSEEQVISVEAEALPEF